MKYTLKCSSESYLFFIRWCILSPLRVNTIENAENSEEQRKLYSKIQQLLMDSVLRLKNSRNNKHAISAQHFAATTRTLTTSLQSQVNISSTLHDLAMARLAQAVSAAMSANCIYGNKRMYYYYYYYKIYIVKKSQLPRVIFCFCYRRIISFVTTVIVPTFFNRMDITNLCF